jgi:hypothetical protein
MRYREPVRISTDAVVPMPCLVDLGDRALVDLRVRFLDGVGDLGLDGVSR